MSVVEYVLILVLFGAVLLVLGRFFRPAAPRGKRGKL